MRLYHSGSVDYNYLYCYYYRCCWHCNNCWYYDNTNTCSNNNIKSYGCWKTPARKSSKRVFTTSWALREQPLRFLEYCYRWLRWENKFDVCTVGESQLTYRPIGVSGQLERVVWEVVVSARVDVSMYFCQYHQGNHCCSLRQLIAPHTARTCDFKKKEKKKI